MALRPNQPIVFDMIGPASQVDVFEEWEQEVAATNQFDGTVGKGLFTWTDGRGRIFRRAVINVGVESKNISLDIVDWAGRRTPIDTRTANIEQKIIIIGNILLAPNEHLEIVTTAATAAMYANITLKR